MINIYLGSSGKYEYIKYADQSVLYYFDRFRAILKYNNVKTVLFSNYMGNVKNVPVIFDFLKTIAWKNIFAIHLEYVL